MRLEAFFLKAGGFGLYLILLIAVSAGTAEAATYLSGQVTLNDAAYTDTTTYVYLSCNGSNWSYCSDSATVDSSGNYAIDSGTNSYGCCSSTYSGNTWNKCQAYAYQWEDSTIANSEYKTVDLSCSTNTTQNLALTPKDKTIAITVSSGNTSITEGISVYCSQTAEPWAYGSASTSTDGVYNIAVTPGTYNCSFYCDWNTYSGNCPYTEYQQTKVTVASTDTTVAKTISTSSKDKTISITVKSGTTALTSGFSAYCSQQVEPWAYGSDSTFSDSGTLDISVAAGTYWCSCSCSSWPCDYSGSSGQYVTVGSSDTSVAAECSYSAKDKTINVTVKSGSTKISSGMSVNCYQQGGGWDSSNTSTADSDGIYQLTVGAGTYSCSAYCSDWKSCDVAGYPQAEIKMTADDTSADVTLTFLKNNATLSGVVTDGSNGLANVYVNINSYQVTNETGAAVGSVVVDAATVTGGTADSTQVYSSAQTDSAGAFSIKLPAGTYTVSVWPPYDRQNLAATSQEVTITKDKTTAIALKMSTKDAQISGKVTDALGNGIQAYVNCSSYSGSAYGGDYAWTETDSSGDYSFYVVKGSKYNCTASANTWGTTNASSLCNYSAEGMQAIAASASTQTLNFTIPTCDCTMTLNAVDASGTIISDINASCDANPSTFDSDEYYYGIWSWISSGTGTMQVQSDREYSFDCRFYDSNYASGDAVTGTCSDGAGSVDITIAPTIEDAVSGSYVDSDGNAVTISTTSYVNVYATKGKNHRSCEANSSSYSCNLSEGTWTLGYWIDENSGYASASAGSTSNEVTVGANGGVTQNISLLKTGSMTITALNTDGSARTNVSVNCCPYSSTQEGANSYQYQYNCGWCNTDSNGQCTVKTGCASGEGTTYYCNAYIPYSMRADEYINSPEEATVSCVEGTTSSATLAYESPDGLAKVTLTEGNLAVSSISVGRAFSVVGGDTPRLKQVVNAAESSESSPTVEASVSCFSPAGGAFQVITDSTGVATCPCTTDDTWYAVAHNLVGNALYMSKTIKLSCSADTGATTMSIDHVTTVPESKSQTVTDAATQSITLELSDGFSVFFPQGATGDSGERVTCNADIVVTPFTANKIPASFYGYSVYCNDSNSVAITQLNSNATFTIPYNQTQMTNAGVSENDIECNYFNDSAGSYTQITTCAIDKTNDSSSFTQNHLTDFVITGTGYLGAVQGEDGGAIGKGTTTSSGASSGCTLIRD
jgi:hypothetical protein